MSRITKWKLEKTKVKVVFRLQFHATHIPQTGWEKLFISFIPTETGKVTAKTTKANVRNGTCKWGDPIYETTRLLLDAKSKLFDDKLYKLVVGMGTSRSSILGEASINLADYADALKPSAVALPLHGTDAGTILHVTVQLLTSKTGFREFEQQRELRETGLSIGSNLNRHDESGTARVSSSEQKSKDQTDKVDTRIRFMKESKPLPSLEEVGESEEYADSQVGCDGSSNTSGSLYADRHDSSSTHENDGQRSTVSGDLNRQTEKGDPSDHRILAHGNNEWVQGWSSDYSVDNELAVDSEENNRLRGSLEVAESSIYDLKLELTTLHSHAEEIGRETQKLADQLVVEIASGQELAKEVSVLKSQCSKFKDDFEQLKSIKLSHTFTNMESDKSKQGMRWLNGLSVVENRIREVQEKAYMGLHQTDFSFLHSDLQVLLKILQDLKNETAEVVSLPGVISTEGAQLKDRTVSLRKSEQLVPGTGFDVDLYEPDSILQYVGLPSLIPHLPESTRDTEAMAGKILELLQQLDEAKVEKETLVRKMDQMECYYENLITELEEHQKQILGEFHSLRNDHSTCLYTLSANKAEMESMHHDMNEQALRFAEERLTLDSLNKELERRAITSEAALKRARLNYSIAVNQLQKDLDLLSFQVLSMFETNQNLINDAFSEPSQLCQGYSNIVQHSWNSNAAIILRDQNQTAGVKNHLLGGDILSDDMKKSLCLQEDLYQKVEVELCEMRSANLYLDIYSNTLQETLIEASTDITAMKKKVDEYALQLELSSESRSLLVDRLQTAVEDVHALNEDKAGCLAQCNHLLLQNQMLEAKLESVSKENFFLTEKLIDCETQVMDYKGYERKYEACFAEKLELENRCKLENLEKGNIQREMSSLNEEFQTLKEKCDELAVQKESMQKLFTFLRDKLGSLLASYDSNFGEVSLSSSSLGHALESEDIKGIIRDLEERQQTLCEKMVKLVEEKKGVENERDMAALSLSTARSEVLGMKQKLKSDIQDMVAKLDISNFQVEKLQMQLESVASKFHISSESEEKYLQHGEELLAYLASLELELQKLSSKNGDLAQELMGLGTMAEELGRCKLTISELMQEKQNLAQEILGLDTMAKELGKTKVSISELKQQKEELVMSLQGKTEESVMLTSELERLTDEDRRSKLIISEMMLGKQDLEISLQSKTEESIKLESELRNLAEELGRSKLSISDLMRENQDLAQEISGLKTMAEELGGSKSTVSELMQEKQDLVTSLRSKTEESIKLKSDLDRLVEELLENKLIISELMQEKQDLAQEILGLKNIAEELGGCKSTISELMQEKKDLEMSLQSKTEESIKLESELRNLAEELGRSKLTISDLMRENQDLAQETLGLKTMAEELGGSKSAVSELMQEKQDLVMSLRSKAEESVKLKSELDRLAKELEGNKVIISELMQEKQDLAQEILGLKNIAEELGGSKSTISELMQEKEDFVRSLQSKTEESIKLSSELDRLSEELGTSKLTISELMQEKQNLTISMESKTEESIKLESELHRVAEELDRSQLTVSELMQEKQGLLMSLQSKTEDSTILESELDRLKESLRCVNDEMHVEKGFRDKLEGTVADLTFQLTQEQEKLVHFDRQNTELVHFRQLASDLESEKTRALNLLLQHEENVEKLQKENCRFNALDYQLIEMEENLIGADAKLCFVQTQYEAHLEELVQQLQLSNERCRELEKKHLDVEATVDRSLASEAQCTEENGKLLRTLKSLTSELEASSAQNGVSSDANNVMKAELEECKNRVAVLEVRLSEDNEQHAIEVEQLKHVLSDLDQEIDSLILSTGESEVIRIVLKAKLDEHNARLTLLDEKNDELIVLRDRCNDLTQKLSDQILKTEEFKNLSIYLKELKVKADAESALAREKRESEGPSIAVQESLRIAFIKEQYETKLQELRQQLSMSKRHGEEILFKLQDAIDENEDRRKSEVSHLKKNEELSLKVLELEAELQSVISDKREKINAYDRIKTELECTLLSLECCKEEKEKLNASLQKCEEEKSKLVVGLSLTKGERERLSSGMNANREANGGVGEQSNFSDDLMTRKVNQRNLTEGIVTLERRNMDDSASISNGNPSPNSLDGTSLKDSEGVQDASSVPIGEVEHPTVRLSAQSVQGVSNSKGVDGTREHVHEDEGDLLLSNSKRLEVVSDHFRAQTLRSSMEHLDEQLERMKNENSALSLSKIDPTFQDLHNELLQLQKVNQELASIYPLFNDLTGTGNALERVLALEIELAEALRVKKKSSIQFQSSFLKQHSDKEAVFKSFRDINELIRDMLELKGKYTNVETELTEMHNRYSQLSLQFAEVEGERQKLTMTLKNVRASNRKLQLNRSSSATLTQGDHSL